jgi:ATP-binding cassette subfamily B protein
MQSEKKKGVPLRFWVRFLKGSRVLFGVGVFLGLLDALAQSSVPLFFRFVINAVQDDAAAFMQSDFVPTLIMAFALLVAFLPVAYFFHVCFTVALMRFCRNLQVSLYAHVQRLSMDFFQRNRVGEINARLNQDLESVANATGAFAGLVWAPSVLIYSVVMMFRIDVPLALLCTFLLFLVSVYTVVFMPLIKRWNREVRDASGEVSALLTELVGMSTLVKAYAGEDYADGRLKSLSDRLLGQRVRLTWNQFLFSDVLQMVTRFLAPMLLLFLGAMAIRNGTLKGGDLAAFWGYWLQLGGIASGIVMAFSAVMAAFASLDRLGEYLRESPVVKDPDKPLPVAGLEMGMRLEGVHFRYPVVEEGEGPVLHGVDLVFEAGKTTAIVGPSGGGKSTLLQLLMRFYDPDQGRVLLGGVDLRSLRQEDLRNRLALVMQESLFFGTSIADNLRMAVPTATEAQMWAALEAAYAADFVRALPGQLEAPLGERGAKLSGGQRQRLSIARAFLKDAPILLLDEPTSALDAGSEQKIKEAMRRLLAGRTAIVVAHRIATIRDADHLILLDRGRVLGQGTHESLRQTQPLYRHLCEQQGL